MKTLESELQKACVYWFRMQYPKLRSLLFSVPNGGYRNIATARNMVAEGVVRGVADLLFLYPSKDYHGLCIEMKTDKGRQSEFQKQWQTAVESVGYKYVVCRSIDEFKATVTDYFKLQI